MSTLTPKREKFCQAIASGKTQADAYREAFNASKMKDSTIHKRASELMANGEIKGRVETLREPIIKKSQLTLDGHLNDLLGLRNLAAKSNQYAVAVNAEIARGKAAGLYVEKIEANLTNKPLPSSIDEFV